ncbi:MAG: dephospho-CoA kinase, partial [Deltaproteobacteria bacterium]|nr:dephospho-CoA kinase [Deltaproteobacteria bacterium]
MMLVGLTGGIASGKSTAAGFLKECGAIIIDVDEISRDMVKPGMPGLQRIESCFGDEIITSEGSLDRDKLGSIVFASEAKRELLNKVLHPFIIDEMHHRIAAVTAYGNIVVADVPLLIECGMQKDFDKII